MLIPTLPHDRDVRLGRRRRHPGRPEGVRGRGLPRHVALVALTAQNTTAVTAVHELPPDFVRAQLEAVFGRLGVDAAKTGMLFSRPLIETVADFLEEHPRPARRRPGHGRELGRHAPAGRRRRDARRAAVPARHGRDAEPARGRGARRRRRAPRRELAERLHALGAPAVVVTGGHGADPVDHLFDGRTARRDPGRARTRSPATHGAGCTHSATLAAQLAHGAPLEDAAAHGRAASPPRPCATVSSSSARAKARRRLRPAEACDERLARHDAARAARAKPLVHQITNYVVMNETANATLALGALPVMAHAREEVEEMVGLAGALVLNIGTLSPAWVEAMLLAGRAANERGIPVVLDPGRRRGDALPDRDREAAPRRGRRRGAARKRGRGGDARRRRGGGARRRVDRRRRRPGRARARGRRARSASSPRSPARRPRLGRRRACSRRERPRAARDGHRDGLHVDRDHRLLPRGEADDPLEAAAEALAAFGVAGEDAARDAQRPGHVPRRPLRRARRARSGDARRRRARLGTP